MFSAELKNVKMDEVVEKMDACQSQSVLHWIMVESEDSTEEE